MNTRNETIENYYSSTTEYEYACHGEEEPTNYFKKEWHGFDFKTNVNGIDYYVTTYPLDIEESDTVVVRVYEDEQHSDDKECGNGIWVDSSFNCISGNDELYFSDNMEEHEEIENKILNEVETLLKKEGVIW